MKTNLLFSSLVISALSINAQITINTGDMPVAGQTYISANDSTVSSFGTSGTNQTWNFSGWANQSNDTSHFVTPSTVAGFSSFPTATLATPSGGGNGFMRNSSGSFDILGFYANFGFGPTAITFSPVQKFITFPSNYLTSFNGTSKYVLQFNPNQPGLDSMRIKSSNIYTSTIDAWGMLTTPAFTNLSSLRQKYTEIRRDSTFLKPTGQAWILSPSNPNPTVDTTITYRWWSNTKKYPVVEITTDGNNVISKGTYLTSLAVGVNELTSAKDEVNVYPNPASDKVNFMGTSSESHLVIFDINGKLVSTTLLKKGSSSIITSNYENGIYVYQIVSLTGTTIQKGKFVIAK